MADLEKAYEKTIKPPLGGWVEELRKLEKKAAGNGVPLRAGFRGWRSTGEDAVWGEVSCRRQGLEGVACSP